MAETELAVKLTLQDKLSAGLKDINKQISTSSKDWKANFGEISDGMKKVGIGMAAVGGAIVGSLMLCAKSFADTGEELMNMSKRTGITVEKLSALGYAAKITNVSISTLEGGIKFMQRSLITGSDAFKTLGLSISNLLSMSPDKQFETIAGALANVQDPALKASLAMDIFGRSGTELLPMLEGGATGLKEMEDKAKSLGVVMSTESAKKAAEFKDKLVELQASFDSVKLKIGEALMPTLISLAEKITTIITKVTDWTKAHPGLTDALIKFAAVLGGTLAAAGLIGMLGNVIGSVTTIIGLIPKLITLIGGLSLSIGTLELTAAPLLLLFIALTASIIGAYVAFQHWAEIPDWLKPIVTILLGIPGMIIVIIKAFEWLFDIVDKFLRFLGLVTTPRAPALPEAVTLPGKQFGGVVPGMRGQPMPILAHGGEVIESGLHGGIGQPIYVTVMGSVITERDLADTIRREIIKTQYRNYSSGIV